MGVLWLRDLSRQSTTTNRGSAGQRVGMKSLISISAMALIAALALATASVGLLSLIPQSPYLAAAGFVALLIYVGWEASRRTKGFIPRTVLFVAGSLGGVFVLVVSVWFFFNVLAPGS